VAEIHLAALHDRLQFDRNQRDALRRGLPRPGELQPAVGQHFLVRARYIVLLPVGHPESDAITAAHAHVEFGADHRVHVARTEPAAQRLRVGPGPPDLFGRDRVAAGDGEAMLFFNGTFWGRGCTSSW
jgi:hypothetical protein